MKSVRDAAMCASAAVVLALAAAAPAQGLGIYVALGDSYTAGPFIPNAKGEPIDCGQSDHNYPTLAAEVLRPSEFRDVSCGGAQTRHMTEPQTRLTLGGSNPPQFGALSPDVELVTLGIGGNDMGFGGIIEMCARLGIMSGGQGRPCTEHYNASGSDQVAERLETVVEPRVAGVIAGIKERSPAARIVVVGYPDPVPQQPGCYPLAPLAPGDLPWLHEVAANLDRMEARVAAASGAEYVELLGGSIGHDICQPPGIKWYEGMVPTSPAYPAHPNALGMEFAARELLAALGQAVPNRFGIRRARAARGGEIALRLRAPHRGAFSVVARAGVWRYRSARLEVPAAGSATVRLEPGRAALRALRRRRLRVRVAITFTPVAGEPRTRSRVLGVGPARRSR